MADILTQAQLGADIDLRSGDLTFNSYSDVQLIAGAALVEQRLYLRLLTQPGTLLGHPEYGAGLGAYLEQPFDSSQAASVADLVRAQLVLDSAVAAVGDVQISAPAPGTLRIEAAVTLAGSTVSVPLSLVITPH